EPVSPADFMRYLFVWQHVDPTARLAGVDGVRAALEALDGYEVAADAWERSVLPARVEHYEGTMLDTLSLTGEMAWARLSTPGDAVTQVVWAPPIALFLREHGGAGAALKGEAGAPAEPTTPLAPASAGVLDALRARGALFANEIATAAGLDDRAVRGALADLVA